MINIVHAHIIYILCARYRQDLQYFIRTHQTKFISFGVVPDGKMPWQCIRCTRGGLRAAVYRISPLHLPIYYVCTPAIYINRVRVVLRWRVFLY